MTASTTLRHVRWRGEDDPRRVDSAETELGPGWLLAQGVRYESLDDTFQSELTIDPDGPVLDCPQLARRLD